MDEITIPDQGGRARAGPRHLARGAVARPLFWGFMCRCRFWRAGWLCVEASGMSETHAGEEEVQKKRERGKRRLLGQSARERWWQLGTEAWMDTTGENRRDLQASPRAGTKSWSWAVAVSSARRPYKFIPFTVVAARIVRQLAHAFLGLGVPQRTISSIWVCVRRASSNDDRIAGAEHRVKRVHGQSC
ncbi:hypothetical protein AXG93_4794s1260 [Marchantia polymorpha subsp. ruderalis]|uniref:Uncharacterized protein n=1 Tax=Marchantia polymorpha subsp. ruderalis TaxID=1480154 RepID=A0A176VF32_MARPO|nr:hypothetical protein AXG93_4794s1260 [Marchantia polymorpha subsp. ruderalis]